MVTEFDRIAGGACRARSATPTMFRNRAIPAIASFVTLLRCPGGSVSTIS